ncbi:MAG TPA: hypothetical protein VF730_14370 [Terracidiphilus sp.]
MSTPVGLIPLDKLAEYKAACSGTWTAMLLALLTITTFVIGLATPPRSGPFCTGTCIAYPYSDAAQFVPGDFIWMVPGILLAPIFVVITVCIHACAQKYAQHWTLLAVCCASVAAAIITSDYFIQLEVVQPSLSRAETIGVALFSQYNPHGVFIALEDLGYLVLSAAFFFAGAAFPLVRGISAALRCSFVAAAVLSFGTFAAMSLAYRLEIGFSFEIMVITIDWTTLIVSSVLLAIHFRRLARRLEAGVGQAHV